MKWLISILFLTATLTVEAQIDSMLVRVPPPAVTNSAAHTNMGNGVILWINDTNNSVQISISAPSMLAISNFMFNTFPSLAQVTNIAYSTTNGYSTIVYSNPGAFYPMNNPSNYISISGGGGSAAQVLDYITPLGTNMLVASQATNYWWDFGRSNQFGAITYFTINTVSNVNFIGLTNGHPWELLTVDVVAGAALQVTWPTNAFSVIDTNGLYLVNTMWGLTLSNGSHFVMSIWTNATTVEPLWRVIGPSSVSYNLTPTNLYYPLNSNPAGYIAPTNPAVDGYVVSATGDKSKWIANPASTGGNILPYYSSSTLIFTAGGNTTYIFDLSRAPVQKCQIQANAAGGAAHFGIVNFQANTSQHETYKLYVTCAGTNTLIDWLTPSSGATTLMPLWDAPGANGVAVSTLLLTNQMYLFTVDHIGGQTNYAIRYDVGTNGVVPAL